MPETSKKSDKKTTKTFRTIAKVSEIPVDELDKCWTQGKKAYEREMAKAKKGQREPIREKYPYIMAVALRIAQGTDREPHVPLSQIRKQLKKKLENEKEKKGKKSKSECFEVRLNSILESI